MTQEERRIFQIKYLLDENPKYRNIQIPVEENQQKQLLRSLVNIRQPQKISMDFLNIQNEYLQAIVTEKGITDIDDLTPIIDGIYLWQGDITTLKCTAIVNAANSEMTGCYCPCHSCIDNAIHTFAGVQLRLECAEIMSRQGYNEPTGKAKLTKAYNLPCKFILHTVGPIIRGKVTTNDEILLASSYRSCLGLAEQNNMDSVAFCCISTGEFHFPNERAAEIAIETVKNYMLNTRSKIKVVFNVFKDKDYEIYERLLLTN